MNVIDIVHGEVGDTHPIVDTTIIRHLKQRQTTVHRQAHDAVTTHHLIATKNQKVKKLPIGGPPHHPHRHRFQTKKLMIGKCFLFHLNHHHLYLYVVLKLFFLRCLELHI